LADFDDLAGPLTAAVGAMPWTAEAVGAARRGVADGATCGWDLPSTSGLD
jgi:hypothetical protein